MAPPPPTQFVIPPVPVNHPLSVRRKERSNSQSRSASPWWSDVLPEVIEQSVSTSGSSPSKSAAVRTVGDGVRSGPWTVVDDARVAVAQPARKVFSSGLRKVLALLGLAVAGGLLWRHQAP